jgi:hypothetical protein
MTDDGRAALPASADRGARGFRLVTVGVRYCLTHNGIANEDDYVCDFADGGACNFRELYRKERR